MLIDAPYSKQTTTLKGSHIKSGAKFFSCNLGTTLSPLAFFRILVEFGSTSGIAPFHE